jgi:hypothetical protein
LKGSRLPFVVGELNAVGIEFRVEKLIQFDREGLGIALEDKTLACDYERSLADGDYSSLAYNLTALCSHAIGETLHDPYADAVRPSRITTTYDAFFEKLRRRNERLEAELARTKLALEITGKAHALLELLSESADTDPKSKP